jgi:hypothetical protein
MSGYNIPIAKMPVYKVVLVHAMKVHRGTEIRFRSCLTSVPPLYPRERTQWIGGWVELRTGLEGFWEEEISYPYRNSNPLRPMSGYNIPIAKMPVYKVVLVHAMKVHRGTEISEIWFPSCLTSVPPLSPRGRTGWVGPRTGLEGFWEEEISYPCRNSNPGSYSP